MVFDSEFESSDYSSCFWSVASGSQFSERSIEDEIDLPMLKEGNIGAAKLVLEKNGFALPRYSDSAKVTYVLQESVIAAGALCLMIAHSSISMTFSFDISKCKSVLPAGTINNAEMVYKELPRWQETAEGARDRYLEVIQSLADKYPSENLLLVTHESIRGIYPNIHLVIIQTLIEMASLFEHHLKNGMEWELTITSLSGVYMTPSLNLLM